MNARVALIDCSRDCPEAFFRARALSSLPLLDRGYEAGFDHVIDCLEGRLQLVEVAEPAARPLVVDFEKEKRNFDAADLLRRAVGRTIRRVVDTTAGLGGDAVHLARLGIEVIAVERCEPIAVLLADGLAHLSDAQLAARISLHVGDARRLAPEFDADTAYLDPMFESADRSRSLPRRRMRLARDLAGCDDDAAELLAVCRSRFRRVVVKRPDKSPPLAGGVHHSHRGKTVRYDVYLDPSRDRTA